jgi:hypothetical protein
MALADQYSGKDIRLQTAKEYGYALSLTNATIRDTATSIQDETFMAVWLLGLYEVLDRIPCIGLANVSSKLISSLLTDAQLSDR